MDKVQTCVCGCGEPAAYAAQHVNIRLRVVIRESDYVVSDLGFESPCWLWIQGLEPNGYGRTRVKGRRMLVHRAMYEQAVGPIPPGHHVHHRCSVRHCVNPEHLQALAPRPHLRTRSIVKLTEEGVRDIRTRRLRAVEFAALYGISKENVHVVQRGETWADVK